MHSGYVAVFLQVCEKKKMQEALQVLQASISGMTWAIFFELGM